MRPILEVHGLLQLPVFTQITHASRCALSSSVVVLQCSTSSMATDSDTVCPKYARALLGTFH